MSTDDDWNENLHGGRSRKQVESQMETVSELGKVFAGLAILGLAGYGFYVLLLVFGLIDKTR